MFLTQVIFKHISTGNILINEDVLKFYKVWGDRSRESDGVSQVDILDDTISGK